MSQMLSGLREIRCSIESLPPEPVASSETPMRTIRIVEIPSGHFFRSSEIAQNGFEITPQLTLEHQVEASPIPDSPPQSEAPIVEPPLEYAPANARDNAIHHGLHLVKTSQLSEAEEETRTINNLRDEINALARKMGVDVVV